MVPLNFVDGRLFEVKWHLLGGNVSNRIRKDAGEE
jgi:hypothetical protein